MAESSCSPEPQTSSWSPKSAACWQSPADRAGNKTGLALEHSNVQPRVHRAGLRGPGCLPGAENTPWPVDPELRMLGFFLTGNTLSYLPAQPGACSCLHVPSKPRLSIYSASTPIHPPCSTKDRACLNLAYLLWITFSFLVVPEAAVLPQHTK